MLTSTNIEDSDRANYEAVIAKFDESQKNRFN